jgi:hypothetical protein
MRGAGGVLVGLRLGRSGNATLWKALAAPEFFACIRSTTCFAFYHRGFAFRTVRNLSFTDIG